MGDPLGIAPNPFKFKPKHDMLKVLNSKRLRCLPLSWHQFVASIYNDYKEVFP